MNKLKDMSVAGCVLAGGQSRRMGTDKALLEFEGKPLIACALERLSGFSEIFVSAAAAESYAFTGARIVPDEHPGMGPLGGFISALRAADSDYVCFRPVDAPLIPAELHYLIAGACLGKDAAVPTVNGFAEPLLACLSKTALTVLEELASGKNYKAGDAFPLLETAYVTLENPDIFSAFGEPSAYLVNANDPDTFAKLGKRR